MHRIRSYGWCRNRYWRTQSSRSMEHLDFVAGIGRLESGSTKNGRDGCSRLEPYQSVPDYCSDIGNKSWNWKRQRARPFPACFIGTRLGRVKDIESVLSTPPPFSYRTKLVLATVLAKKASTATTSPRRADNGVCLI